VRVQQHAPPHHLPQAQPTRSTPPPTPSPANPVNTTTHPKPSQPCQHHHMLDQPRRIRRPPRQIMQRRRVILGPKKRPRHCHILFTPRPQCATIECHIILDRKDGAPP
jgi:hypothetical protein